MSSAASLVASIPSPPFNTLGPLNIYGLMIALGVVTAAWIGGRRFEQRGVGTADDAGSITIWAVVAGVIGARLYHVITDWERFEDNLSAIPKIWEGGLGIPGGLIVGIPAGLYLAHRRGIPVSVAATCAAPAIPAAQAIGRLGNYFNQELYGRPTDLPWALEIDAQHLVDDPATGLPFAVGTTFHPTFLYELLWSVAVVFVLIAIDRKWRPGGGSLMGLFVASYGVGRFWVEGLRVDPADDVGPFRWNQWMALIFVAVGLIAFFALRGRPDPVLADAASDDRSDDDAADVMDGDPTDARDHQSAVGQSDADADVDADADADDDAAGDDVSDGDDVIVSSRTVADDELDG